MYPGFRVLCAASTIREFQCERERVGNGFVFISRCLRNDQSFKLSRIQANWEAGLLRLRRVRCGAVFGQDHLVMSISPDNPLGPWAALRQHNELGTRQRPFSAALSGSHPKSPGFAGGTLPELHAAALGWRAGVLLRVAEHRADWRRRSLRTPRRCSCFLAGVETTCGVRFSFTFLGIHSRHMIARLAI